MWAHLLIRWLHLLALLGWLIVLVQLNQQLGSQRPLSRDDLRSRFFLLWEMSALILVSGVLALIPHIQPTESLFPKTFLLFLIGKLGFAILLFCFQGLATWHFFRAGQPSPGTSNLVRLFLWLALSMLLPLTLLGILLGWAG